MLKLVVSGGYVDTFAKDGHVVVDVQGPHRFLESGLGALVPEESVKIEVHGRVRQYLTTEGLVLETDSSYHFPEGGPGIQVPTGPWPFQEEAPMPVDPKPVRRSILDDPSPEDKEPTAPFDEWPPHH